MPLIDGPDGPLEIRLTGSGEPVTAFAHGLASSIDETRPFGSGVSGTRVFLHFRGHGATYGPENPWTYAGVESELTAVMERYGARRALGVSLGAGALLRRAVTAPDSCDRLVFVLPGAIDQPRRDPAIERMQLKADLVEDRDIERLAAMLVDEQPVLVRARPDAQVWARRRARRLADSTVARALRELPQQYPVEPGRDLSVVSCPCLVIGQEDDPAHPADLARALAARLPDAQLRIFDGQGLVWGHRGEVRDLISGFLNHP